MCFVCGCILCTLAILTQPLLSSNALQWILGFKKSLMKLQSLSSWVRVINRITSCNACERQMHSALQLLSTIYNCSFDAHSIGQPLIVITYPDCKFCAWIQLSNIPYPVSQKICIIPYFKWYALGLMIIHFWHIPFKYLPKYITALMWASFGLAQKRTDWCTEYAMSGLVLFSKKFSFPMTFL